MKAGWFVVVGLILGLVGGLLYGWVLRPVQYVETYPPLMHEHYRADWIRMTALAYGADGDLGRTQVRLRDLDEVEIRHQLEQTLEQAIASGRPLSVLQRVANLAERYGVEHPAVGVYTSEQASLVTPRPAATFTPSPTPEVVVSPTVAPSPSPLPSPTPTLDPDLLQIPPTATPTLTVPTGAAAPFVFTEGISRCLPAPRLAISVTQEVTVTVRGREQRMEEGVPGIEAWLTWAEGADRAVTGFRPALGVGYADFHIEAGEMYNLYLGQPTGAPLTTVQSTPCEDGEWRSWIFVIRRQTASP